MSLVSQIATLSTSKVSSIAPGTLPTKDELNAVTLSMVETHVTNCVNKWDVSNFDFAAAKALFSYEGFDPKEVYTHLLAKKIAGKVSDDDFQQDIYLILALQHIKGNVTPSNIKNLKPEAQDMVGKILQRYGIFMQIGTEKRRAVTLPRIAAAYPVQCTIIASKIPKDFSGPYQTSILPAFMKSSGFASTIPTGTDISKFLVAVYAAYLTDMSIALKKANYSVMKNDEKLAEFNNSLKYADIMFNGVLLEEDEKCRLMLAMNIGAYYDKLAKIYKLVGLDEAHMPKEKTFDAVIKEWSKV